MSFRGSHFAYISVVLAILFGVSVVQSLQFCGSVKKVVETIQNYFQHENCFCVMPTLHVAAVVFTQDRVLQDCGSKSTDQGGYIFMTSNAVRWQYQIIPLLRCFNRSTLKLKTKYILILDFSDSNPGRYEAYSYFFRNIWDVFGIINIAILPVQDQILSHLPTIISYNPFIARHHSSPRSTLKMNTQDVREFMVGRLRDLHGQRLRTIFCRLPNSFVTLENVYEKQTVGGNPGILFKQILEANLNASFDVYQSSNNDVHGVSGKARVWREKSAAEKQSIVPTFYCCRLVLRGRHKCRRSQVALFWTWYFWFRCRHG